MKEKKIDRPCFGLIINLLKSLLSFKALNFVKLFEMTNKHLYYALHLPTLSVVSVEGERFRGVEEMVEYFAFYVLKTKKQGS